MDAERVAVEFVDVGRGKATWTALLPNLEQDTLYRHIRAKRVLMSRDIGFVDDGIEGSIFAGAHKVGTYRVLR